MRFKIKEIPQLGTPQRVDRALPAELLADALEGSGADPAQASGKIEVELTRDHEDVIAHGRLRVTLVMPCSRCVEPATVKISTAVDAVFTREGAEPEEPADVEALLESPDAFTHDGISISLDEVCREVVIAELPLSPKCKASCKGLCATCGANLNTEPCGHPVIVDEPVRGPLAGLADVKIS